MIPIMEDVRGCREEERVSLTLDLSKNHSESIASFLDPRIWSSLSPELLEQIRTFLPPSSLFRFRCVCKRWNLLNSDPGFIKLYNQTAPPTMGNIIFIAHDHRGKRLRALYLESLSKWFTLPIDFLPKHACIPMAENRGLLCVGSLVPGDGLWVCNPLTKNFRRLPDCGLPELRGVAQRPLVNIIVKASGVYNVVLVLDPGLSNTFSTVVKVYDSQTGCWTDYKSQMQVRANLSSNCVIRDGVLYWCTMSPDGLHAYNLSKGDLSHKQVRFPRYFATFGDSHLIQIGGHIGLIGLKLGGQSFAIGMWELKEGEQQLQGASPVTPEWVERPWGPGPAFRREWCQLQGIVLKNLVCLATMESHNWVYYDIVKGTWCSGVTIPDHRDEDQEVGHSCWHAYEPRLGISV